MARKFEREYDLIMKFLSSSDAFFCSWAINFCYLKLLVNTSDDWVQIQQRDEGRREVKQFHFLLMHSSWEIKIVEKDDTEVASTSWSQNKWKKKKKDEGFSLIKHHRKWYKKFMRAILRCARLWKSVKIIQKEKQTEKKEKNHPIDNWISPEITTWMVEWMWIKFYFISLELTEFDSIHADNTRDAVHKKSILFRVSGELAKMSEHFSPCKKRKLS